MVVVLLLLMIMMLLLPDFNSVVTIGQVQVCVCIYLCVRVMYACVFKLEEEIIIIKGFQKGIINLHIMNDISMVIQHQQQQ